MIHRYAIRYYRSILSLVVYIVLSDILFAQTIETKNDEQKEAVDTVTIEQAREREQMAQEDPLAVRQSDRVDRKDDWAEDPDDFNLYGSIRIRYRVTDVENFWGDGDSRLGANGQWQYSPKHWIFGRIELGFNVLDELDLVFDPAGNSRRGTDNKLFLRLGYLGLETSNAMYIAGKNWSTYYQVAGFTDRFDSSGGEATGVFNAGTDGGPFGTGRADGVLQSRFLIDLPGEYKLKPFHLNVQLQYDQPIPLVTNGQYGVGLGLSAIYESRDDFSIGLAYNYANVRDKNNADVLNAGIDGNAQAGLLGLRWFGKHWYAATSIARLQNVETTDNDLYFDGWGWEVYSQYNLHQPWWIVAGWNVLQPDTDEAQAGQYELKYAVLGVRYSFKDFQQMLYFDVRLDYGQLSDGSVLGDVYTVGGQWDL